MGKFASCIYFTLGLIGLVAAAIPDYIQICHQSDPELNACIKNSVDAIKPKLKKGIPEIGVPPMEPLQIEDIKLNLGNGRFYILLNLTDVTVFGASDFELKKLKLDIDNIIYKMDVYFPKVLFTGNYSVDTKILSLPIKAKGRFTANATNIHGTGILKGELVRDKFEHLHFSDLPVDLKIGDYNLRLDNIVAADEALNDAINELANSNKAELIKITTPFIETRVSSVLLNIANKITENLEYDEVFPKK